MKTPLFIVAAVLSAAGSPVRAESVTGSWSKCGPAASGLWLKTIQTGGKVLFHLRIDRGAPAHHSGFTAGEFELRGDKGVFVSAEDGQACEITFIFSPQQVAVNESPYKHDCGFGHGVTASGQLILNSSERPRMIDGDEAETDFPSCPEAQEKSL